MYKFTLFVMVAPFVLFAEEWQEEAFLESTPVESPLESPPALYQESPDSFIGSWEVVGENVHLRMSPSLNSQIIKRLNHGDKVEVVGEFGDFWKVAPKVYVYRKYISVSSIEGSNIKGEINGTNVNVRFNQPSMDAPIIMTLDKGYEVIGKICPTNDEWVEVACPEGNHLYISKKYVKKWTPSISSGVAEVVAKEEPSPPSEPLVVNFVAEKSEPFEVAKAPESKVVEKPKVPSIKITDEMKRWLSIEEERTEYLSWQVANPGKKRNVFYEECSINAKELSGILVPYDDPVKNKPGDFKLLSSDKRIIAYLYSVQVNLRDPKYNGEHITIQCLPRENNNFAHPAYYVIGVK